MSAEKCYERRSRPHLDRARYGQTIRTLSWGNLEDKHDEANFWDGIALIPDEELWAVREALRSYLIAFIRERARQLWTQKQVTAA